MALKVLVTYTAKPGHAPSFLSDIVDKGLRDNVLAEDGCLQYDYFTAAGNPDQILLVETWESREAQKIHMDQPHMAGIHQAKEDHILDVTLELFDF